jgi:hypothetical protein
MKKGVENYLWETFNAPPCPKEGCWCRGIRVVKLGRGRKPIVVDISFLSQEQAELIVKIHNEWLVFRKQNARTTRKS